MRLVPLGWVPEGTHPQMMRVSVDHVRAEPMPPVFLGDRAQRMSRCFPRETSFHRDIWDDSRLQQLLTHRSVFLNVNKGGAKTGACMKNSTLVFGHPVTFRVPKLLNAKALLISEPCYATDMAMYEGLVDFVPVDEFSSAHARLVRCLLYTSPSPRDRTRSRMPSSA